MTDAKPNLKVFFLYILVIIVAAIGLVFVFSKDNNVKTEEDVKTASKSGSLKTKTYSKEPEMILKDNKKYSAVLTTSKGKIAIDLLSKENPITVNNFVFLGKEGFYDNTVFHRVIKDFMIQGGDPMGNGTGSPGYKLKDEKITRDYKRGTIAMANSGPNTNGSQFFIMHKDYNLPKNYEIFGLVTDGIDTVDKIADVNVLDNGYGEKSKPAEEVKLEKVEIVEK